MKVPDTRAMLDHVDTETYRVDSGWAREPVLPADVAPVHALIRGSAHRYEIRDAFDRREPNIIEDGQWLAAACGRRCQVILPVEFDDDPSDTDLCKDCVREVAEWVIAPLGWLDRHRARRARRLAREIDEERLGDTGCELPNH